MFYFGIDMTTSITTSLINLTVLAVITITIMEILMVYYFPTFEHDSQSNIISVSGIIFFILHLLIIILTPFGSSSIIYFFACILIAINLPMSLYFVYTILRYSIAIEDIWFQYSYDTHSFSIEKRDKNELLEYDPNQ